MSTPGELDNDNRNAGLRQLVKVPMDDSTRSVPDPLLYILLTISKRQSVEYQVLNSLHFIPEGM